MAARRIQVRPAVLDHLTGTLGATAKLTPARGRSGSRSVYGGAVRVGRQSAQQRPIDALKYAP